jgi:hypothetical protein
MIRLLGSAIHFGIFVVLWANSEDYQTHLKESDEINRLIADDTDVGEYQLLRSDSESEIIVQKQTNSKIAKTELEYLARTMFSEYCDTTNERHLKLIASVILNRRDADTKQFKYESVIDVVSNRKQFSGFMNSNWCSAKIPNKHWEIAKQILNDGVPSQFQQIYFFANLSIVKDKKTIKWFKSLPFFEHHNGHSFFKIK